MRKKILMAAMAVLLTASFAHANEGAPRLPVTQADQKAVKKDVKRDSKDVKHDEKSIAKLEADIRNDEARLRRDLPRDRAR